MTKRAKDLASGDRIPPPAHERKWLPGPLTVVSVREGRGDKRGAWVLVEATFASPYSPGRTSSSTWRFRPETEVVVLG